MILKRDVAVSSGDIYKELMRGYVAYIQEEKEELDLWLISELFRHSLCKALGLESKAATKRIGLESCADLQRRYIDPIVKRYKLLDQSYEYRQGTLEACMHYTERMKGKLEDEYYIK